MSYVRRNGSPTGRAPRMVLRGCNRHAGRLGTRAGERCRLATQRGHGLTARPALQSRISDRHLTTARCQAPGSVRQPGLLSQAVAWAAVAQVHADLALAAGLLPGLCPSAPKPLTVT
jgi:hypothetical protein